MKTSHTIQLDVTQTVNQIVADYPQTIPVFSRFSIDTCCGGGLPLEEVARRHALDLHAVVAAVREAIGAEDVG